MLKRNVIINIFRCIKDEVVDNLPKILEPLVPYGKSIGIFLQSVHNGIQKVEKDTQDELKEELINMASQIEAPKYMGNVMFISPKGYTMSEEQQDNLKLILMQEFESTEEGHLALIAEFIRQYMGDNLVPDCVDEYEMGKDYLWLNFFYMCEEDLLPYDENDMKLVMESLNALMGEEVFDKFVIGEVDWE